MTTRWPRGSSGSGAPTRSGGVWLLKSLAVTCWLLLGVSSPWAQTCAIAIQSYDLVSESVDWSTRIRAGQSCVGGFRGGSVMLDSIELIEPPTTGELVLKGLGFRYKAKADFQGDDLSRASVAAGEAYVTEVDARLEYCSGRIFENQRPASS